MASSSSTIAKDAALLESVDTSSTMDLHRSNLMRMQVTELLEECQLDLQTRKWATDAQDYMRGLSKILLQVNLNTPQKYQDRADKAVSIQSTSRLSVEPIGCTKTPFGWTKRAGNAQVLPTFTLMVMLPSDLFSAKDYLHYRYFDKRNFVMDLVAKHLANQSKKLGKVEYVWSKGMNRCPILQLVPSYNKKAAPKFQVHLHFGMVSNCWIPRLRTVPNRCNIKETTTLKAQWYNHCLLYDSRQHFEDAHLHDLVGQTNVEATLVLIQIWALQRGLWRNHDGWTKENVALLLVYLLRTHKMNSRMTPIQIFTVVLQTWATTSWLGDEDEETTTSNVRAAHSKAAQLGDTNQHRTVLVLPSKGSNERETIRQSELAHVYELQTKESPLTESDPPTLIDAYASHDSYALGPVFLDPTMTYNYLGDVSPNFMRVLQEHAKKSLEGLKKSRSAFKFLFMTSTRFWSQWDIYVQIPVLEKESEDWEFAVRQLVRTLYRALGNRIHGMRVLSTENGDIISGKIGANQLPSESAWGKATYKRARSQSPTGTNKLVVGIAVNPETSQRVVDRGPPSENHIKVKSFVKLWGQMAKLRRFKDGAIVQAVVWNENACNERFQNAAKLNGGYIEKIIRHIVQLHFTKQQIHFSLPNLLSVVDGVKTDDKTMLPFVDPLYAHQNMMKAFDSLSDYLKTNSQQPSQGSLGTSQLGLPLAIDAIEPLSPCLRYSELYPPIPHPFLGGSVTKGKKVSGALLSNPIVIQIRFGSSSKWPSDLKAIGAAKTAMLIQLANGIEMSGEKGFDGPISVTPSYADLGYKGYCFRVLVRADPEIRMLQGLVKPNSVARGLLKDLTRKHVIASKHHSTIHAVHTLHPSAGTVVRVAKRWVASHLLSGLISDEAIELMVAKVYSDSEALLEAPGTVMAGFLRFLHLLGTHDWSREPLVINPRGHINNDEYDEIYHQFEAARGENKDFCPMYIVAPYDKLEMEEGNTINQNIAQAANLSSWHPSVASPEWVVVTRAAALARRSFDFMKRCLTTFDETDWSSVFHETAISFKSYSILFRIDSAFIVDSDSSSTGGNLSICENADGVPESTYTRSMNTRFLGPKHFRKKLYRNLQGGAEDTLLLCWQPIQSVVDSLRRKFGSHALFLYNELCPEVVGVVWRPQTFSPMAFSVMTSDYVRPTNDKNWKANTLVIRNANDLLRAMSEHHQDIVTTVKVFHESTVCRHSKRRKLSIG